MPNRIVTSFPDRIRSFGERDRLAAIRMTRSPKTLPAIIEHLSKCRGYVALALLLTLVALAPMIWERAMYSARNDAQSTEQLICGGRGAGCTATTSPT